MNFAGKLLIAVLYALVTTTAFGQVRYPDKPVKIVVGFPPGTSTDTLTRLVAAKIADGLGQAVVVENKPGAGSSIAAEMVARSAPDGYTLLASSSANTINPSLYKLTFDFQRDLAAIGAKIACPDRVVVSLVGVGGFGQNPAALATAVEEDVAVIWVIMNNGAYGTIAGLQKAHYGTTVGTVFHKRTGEPYSPDYAAMARAYGVEGVRIESADAFKPALEKAMASGRRYVLDVIMENAPVPTSGHWNIMDIYSPGKKVHHVAT